MANRRKMHVPDGTDDITVGTEMLAIDGDHNLEAPEDAVGDLMRVGLTIVSDPPAPVTGLVKVTHVDPAASCSFDNETYSLGKDGFATVPLAALAMLESHGFVAVES